MQNLFELLLQNDPAEVMQIPLSEREVIMADFFWPQDLNLSKSQKIMLFQDRKLLAEKILKERDNEKKILSTN